MELSGRLQNRAVYLALGALIVLAVGWWFSRARRNRPADLPASLAKSVVVLPFNNLGRPEDEYFADGVTEEITSRLTRIAGLRVISRNSAKQYKGTRKPLSQVGRDLGAGYALTGTVRWGTSGDSTEVRVSPELIRVNDGTKVWAHRYDAVVATIFQVQSDIAEQVAGALGVPLAGPERRALAARPTNNPRAYDYYLRGRQSYERGHQEEPLRLSESLYRKALEADSGFALAWAALARSHDLLYWFSYDRTEGRLAQEQEAAERALRLQPNLPEAHLAMGMYHYHGRNDYTAALREFELARQLRPGDSEVYGSMSVVQRRQGKWSEAFENGKRAVELDPRSYVWLTEAGATATDLKAIAEAERYYTEAVTLVPEEVEGYAGLVDVALLRGEREQALETSRQELRRFGTQRLAPALFQAGHLTQLFLLLEDGHSADFQRIDRSAFDHDSSSYYLFKATLYQRQHKRVLARQYGDSARALLELRVREHPDDWRYRCLLSWAYAYGGRKADAIRVGQSAESSAPLSKDAVDGLRPIYFLARSYMLTGELDSAVARLDTMLSVPSGMSTTRLRFDPVWDPLRGNPYFEEMVAEHR